MGVETNITEDMLVEATLDGLPCKGLAWTEVTRVEILDNAGKYNTIDGVRTWRGKAVLFREEFPLDRLYGTALIYSGILKDGEEQRTISGHIFVSNIQGAKPVLPGGDGLLHEVLARRTSCTLNLSELATRVEVPRRLQIGCFTGDELLTISHSL